jgi:hypothetical protein
MNIEQMKRALSEKPKTVEVEVNGCTFKMQGVSDSQRIKEFEFWLRPDGQKLHKVRQAKIRAKIAALAIVDEEGNRPFNNDEGVDYLHEIDAAALSKLSEVATVILGLADEDIEAKLKKTSGD